MKSFFAKLFNWYDSPVSVPCKPIYSRLPEANYYLPKREETRLDESKIDKETQTENSIYTNKTCEIMTDPLCFNVDTFSKKKSENAFPFENTVDFTKIKFGFQKDKPQQTTFSLLSQAFSQKDDIILCCSAPHFEFQTKFGEELVNSTANNNLKQQTVNDDENNNKQNKNNEEESSGSHDTDSNSAEYSDFSSQSD